MNRKKIINEVISGAAKQALVWGASSYLAHKASQVADKHHEKHINKFDPKSKEQHEIDAKNKSDRIRGLGSTLAGATAGYVGTKI